VLSTKNTRTTPRIEIFGNITRVRVLRADHLFSASGWLSPGFVTIDDTGMISAVGTEGPSDAERLRGFVLPGLPNVHSHAFQRALSGLTEQSPPGVEDSFWTWRTRMYGLAHAISPDDLEALAAQLYVEMLERGMTAIGEFHYVHHDKNGARFSDPREMSLAILHAAEQSGIALTHLPVLYLHGGFGAAPMPKQRRFVFRDPEDYLAFVDSLRAPIAALDNARLGIAPHSLRAVDERELRITVAGVPPDAPVHLHVAEQKKEVEESLQHLGARPVQFLLDRIAIDARYTFVHATHLDDAERTALAKSGAVAGLCPTTEANLGDGVFPALEYFEDGGVYGVGSDSHASVSVTEELRLLEYGQRLVRLRRNVLSALYTRAAEGGARSLAQPAGKIAPGLRADLITLDAEHPRLIGHDTRTVIDAWIFGGADDAVREVMVGGRRVVRDGKHVDRERIASRFGAVMRRLISEASTW
jgi:formimidoylglutamate deiminase